MILKRMIVTIFACLILYPVAVPVHASETRAKAPNVAYSAPDNDTVIDLTGKTTLKFEWKRVPIPAGGRSAYKITVYKGFSYDILFSQNLEPNVFSVEVPADKFEDGLTYSWIVKQRDSQSGQWSRYDNWSFRIKKA